MDIGVLILYTICKEIPLEALQSRLGCTAGIVILPPISCVDIERQLKQVATRPFEENTLHSV